MADLTLETLPEFLRSLVEEGKHEYGTIDHTLVAIANAAEWVARHSPPEGVTTRKAALAIREIIRLKDRDAFGVMDLRSDYEKRKDNVKFR
jgi:hypothetical protein